MLKELRIILKGRSGVSFPLMIGVILSLLLISCGVSEYLRLQIIAAGVRNAVKDVIISMVNDNYAGVYYGIRKEYSGGYMPYGEGKWEEAPDEGDICTRINEVFKTRRSGGRHMKFAEDSGDVAESALADLNVALRNAPLALSDLGNVQRSEAEVTIRLEVPARFGRKLLPSMHITLRVQAGYTGVF